MVRLPRGRYGGWRLGTPIIFCSSRASASLGLPSKSSRRTSGKALSASGLRGSRFLPFQTVSSFNWNVFPAHRGGVACHARPEHGREQGGSLHRRQEKGAPEQEHSPPVLWCEWHQLAQ